VPRYELSEGTSNKFWEIALQGSSFTTTYGRIGTDGQTTLKEYDSADKAKKEHDKLVAAKVKKGYKLVGDGGGTAKAAPKKAEPKKAKPKATAKATPKKAAPAAQPTGGDTSISGGPRYELVDGKSSKFWEVNVEGSSVTTTYGRIGTSGQTTVKEHGSASAARKEKAKLIESKTKKGYVLVDPGDDAAVAAAAKSASNPELEAAILEDPDNAEAYLVYADWLQTAGDPRGELIALQHQLSQDPGNKKLQKAVDNLLEQHGVHFVPKMLGEMLAKEKPKKKDWAYYKLETGFCAVDWQYGYLRSVVLARADEDDPYSLEELIAELFAHPSARFLQELRIGALGIADEYHYGDVVDALVKAKPTSLRSLRLADFQMEDSELSWSYLTNVGKLYKVLPRLEHLAFRGGSMTLGTIDLPHLKSFRVETGGLETANIKSIVSAKWPNLESLHLYFGDENYGAGGDVKKIAPILAGQGLPQLRHLGLMNADFTDNICKALPGAKILAQLETLDLSMGTMSDEGAQALADGAAKLKHLKKLDVSDNFLTQKGMDALKGICAEVVTGEQKEPYDWDEDGRYVTVGE